MDDDFAADNEVNTTTLLKKPLFEEVNESHQREDAYGGPYGVIFGGMAVPTLIELSCQYQKAADVLLEQVFSQTVEDFTLSNPVLFLYRHSIEILIKSCLPELKPKHNLDELIDLYTDHVMATHGCGVPSWITSRIHELSEVDPGSTTFRYGQCKTNKSDVVTANDGEIHVYLRDVKQVVHALHSAIPDVPTFRTNLQCRTCI